MTDEDSGIYGINTAVNIKNYIFLKTSLQIDFFVLIYSKVFFRGITTEYLKIQNRIGGSSMGIFNIILGIFAILSSVYCIFFPGLTFLNSGWIVAVLLGTWGFCAIFNFIATKRNGKKTDKDATAMGIVGLIFGIVSAVFSVLALFSAPVRAIIDISIIGMFIGWLVISGINDIVISILLRKKSKLWVLSLIFGIIILISGIYGLFHIVFIGKMIGTLTGILLMIYGVKLIASSANSGV